MNKIPSDAGAYAGASQRVWVSVPHGCNGTWRVTERSPDGVDHVVAMTSFSDTRHGDITLSESKQVCKVVPSQPGGSIRLLKWSYKHLLLISEGKTIATAIKASKLGEVCMFLVEVKSGSYVVSLQRRPQVFTISKVANGDKLDRKKANSWKDVDARKLCEIKWNPTADTSLLCETLTWGYEVVFDEGEDIRLLLFCFWLANSTSGTRINRAQYGPATAGN